MNVPQSTDDLNKHLQEQIGFLTRSADSYDLGFHDEAKRLAVTIRVLLHDTVNSKSLLDQLGQKNRLFYDTAMPEVQNNLLPHAALVCMTIGKTAGGYMPLLDEMTDQMPPRNVTFDEWWQRPIFRNKNNEMLSRKQLVLAVANQDGGAHIDPSLHEVYTKLSRTEGTGWTLHSSGTAGLVLEAELAAVRQIAHEVLRTLDSSYRKKLQIPDGSAIIASPAIVPGGVAGQPQKNAMVGATNPPTTVRYPRVGRNDPCPCGSGKKYKRCHGFQTP